MQPWKAKFRDVVGQRISENSKEGDFIGTEFQVNGLEPCRHYIFHARARNEICSGEWS